MLENIRLSFQGIWSHKMRSILTMLGIIIGIAAIITIVSTIKGTNEQIKENIIGSGNNAVLVRLYEGSSTLEPQYSTIPDQFQPITEDVLQEILNIPEVAEALRVAAQCLRRYFSLKHRVDKWVCHGD